MQRISDSPRNEIKTSNCEKPRRASCRSRGCATLTAANIVLADGEHGAEGQEHGDQGARHLQEECSIASGSRNRVDSGIADQLEPGIGVDGFFEFVEIVRRWPRGAGRRRRNRRGRCSSRGP